MLPLLVPILTQLAGAGMQKVVDSVLDKGVAHVEDKLGITLTPDADGKLSDEKISSLKEAAMKHEEFMFEQEVKDRGDARAAHLAMATNANVHWLEKLVLPILALGIVGVAFALVGVLMFINIPDSQENIVIYALGFLTSAATQVISFYFGSSQGSKDKSDALALKK
jgi:hypothetical protein